jgi:hypothetical protein
MGLAETHHLCGGHSMLAVSPALLPGKMAPDIVLKNQPPQVSLPKETQGG